MVELAIRDERAAVPGRHDPQEVAALADWFEERSPQDLLRWAIAEFGRGLAIATSFQVDGVVLLDMAWRIDPTIRVMTVDSGRLPRETYELIDEVRQRYEIPIEVHYPDATQLSEFVSLHGINSFYRATDLRLTCCEIRKVNPMRRALTGLDAWVSGQRRDHSVTRRHVRKVELDQAHGGLLKLNPLADWSSAKVWTYVREHGIPHNALYDRGFTSIGCAPCTRPTAPGEDPRSGRWWWETGAPKECGIHCSIDLAKIRGDGI
jgi:thioredoxin-dependent adenylylsulfate APS reductase